MWPAILFLAASMSDFSNLSESLTTPCGKINSRLASAEYRMRSRVFPNRVLSSRTLPSTARNTGKAGLGRAPSVWRSVRGAWRDASLADVQKYFHRRVAMRVLVEVHRPRHD